MSKDTTLGTIGFDFSRFDYGTVIPLPPGYEIVDCSKGYDPNRLRDTEYSVGKYNEKRPGMYVTDLFTAEVEAPRDIHVGIDIGAPAGTPVRAFYDGVIYMAGINPAEGDYGGTVITEHDLGGRKIWALHGHLSHSSVAGKKPGQPVKKGDVIAWLGVKAENGGWNPHLHFQLSWEKPEKCDLPGAVNQRDLARALEIYPDPQNVLGRLY
jgi:peptidoglycan LD-endopeptidase LytH